MPFRRERVDTRDGDFWTFDWLAHDARPDAPLIVLFHGLEGGSGSHYARALSRVQEQGLLKSLQETYEPYIEGVWNNFHTDRRTWTDALIDGSAFKTAWSGVRKLFGGDPKAT